MRRIQFCANDTLFFRDGSPFNANEFQSDTQTVFPPSPSTLIGAVRAACARGLGWNGRNTANDGNDWDTVCRSALGSGDDLGPLSFTGPFVSRDGETIFPIPATVMGRIDVSDNLSVITDPIQLRPGQPKHCDLGTVRLPEMQKVRQKTVAENQSPLKLLTPNCWVTRNGLIQVLDGQSAIDPSEIIHVDQLWNIERRIGISRHPSTRTTLAAALYAPMHTRPRLGVQLEMYVDGLTQQAVEGFDSMRLHPIGGESRSGWMEVDDACLPLPPAPKFAENDPVQYSVCVLTPLAADEMPLPGQSFLGLPGVVVSACLPRPQFWGGWNSVANEPLPLSPHIAPGSMIFIEAPAEQASEIEKHHGTCIGAKHKVNWGFGLIVIGKWAKEIL